MKYNPFFSFFYEVYCCQMNHSDVSAISDYGSKIKKTYHTYVVQWKFCKTGYSTHGAYKLYLWMGRNVSLSSPLGGCLIIDTTLIVCL